MNMPRPMDASYKMLIGGKWVEASDGKTLKSYCPANGEYLASFPDATKEDIDSAVKAAWKAFDAWKRVSAQERSALLLKIADLIDANRDKLAMIESLDNGKPIRETSAIDIPLASDHFRYFAGAIRVEEGEVAMIDDNTMLFQYNEKGWNQYANAINLVIILIVLCFNTIINKVTGASIDKGIGG